MKKEHLKKEIGLVTLTAIGVGSVLGSGIFALPAAMAAVAGPGFLLAIILAGIITLFLGMAYAELGAAFPITGGPYSLPRLALGNFGGFVMGWGYFIYLFVGTAAVIDIFIVYLGFYVPGLAVGGTLTPWGVSLAVIALWIFTIINVLGVKWGGLYSVITTIGKLIPLFLFGLIGLAFLQGDNFTPFMPFGFTGVTLAITLFFWSYTGFEAIVVPSEEVKDPHKTIPWAMILTIFVTIFIYLFIAAVFLGMIDWQGLHLDRGKWQELSALSSPLSDVSKSLGLPLLAALATVGAIIATAGAGGSWVLIQGRMPYAMAKDKLFWAPLAKIHPKFGTPAASLIFTSSLTTLILIAIPNFPSVALIASVTAVVPYAAAVLAVPILRKTKPDVPRPFALPWHMVVSAIGFVLATYLIYWASYPWVIVGGILMLTAYPAYLFVRRKRFEWARNLWVPVYLFGVMIVSVLGNKNFVFNNFTPYSPLNLIVMPYDLIILGLFGLIIFIWAYRVNIRQKKY